ncbi:MAG: Ca2+-binding protein, partial [Elusimicrobia bacterium]
MTSRAGKRIGLALAALAALPTVPSAQQGGLCAVVKLEIAQEATLEREAFDAKLIVNNNLPDTPLTSLKVNVFIKDETGTRADSAFFVKLTTLTNTSAVDGTGVVQSSSSAEIRWLIIPSTGAGGFLPGG